MNILIEFIIDLVDGVFFNEIMMDMWVLSLLFIEIYVCVFFFGLVFSL